LGEMINSRDHSWNKHDKRNCGYWQHPVHLQLQYRKRSEDHNDGDLQYPPALLEEQHDKHAIVITIQDMSRVSTIVAKLKEIEKKLLNDLSQKFRNSTSCGEKEHSEGWPRLQTQASSTGHSQGSQSCACIIGNKLMSKRRRLS
jgi:hypothetical protein